MATRVARAMSPARGRPIVTYTIIALCLVTYGIQFLTGDAVTNALIYAPFFTEAEPWRMLTSIFIHASIFHVGLNMYSLWLVGPALETMLGRLRFIVLFLIAGFGGSVGVLLLAPQNEAVLGASGAIFGLFGAYFLIARRLGGNTTFLLIVIVINLVIGFIPGAGIAWQAHVGGLVAGGLVALIYLETRSRNRRWAQILLTGAVVLVLVIVTWAKVALF
ncbi:MAG: rhomboid family intramembrane serine protease [Galbitalea sp.]